MRWVGPGRASGMGCGGICFDNINLTDLDLSRSKYVP